MDIVLVLDLKKVKIIHFWGSIFLWPVTVPVKSPNFKRYI